MHFPGNLLVQRGQTAAELGQSMPLRGERQPPPFLDKQLYPIGRFQRPDVLAYGGLGQVEQLRAAGGALALHQQ